jgi:AAA domain-containing protein
MSRCEAAAVSKGIPFLNRPTKQGEVILCSLEDPRVHVDNHLALLGYEQGKDAQIHITHKLSRNFKETVDFLVDSLAKMRDVNFVILDTLAKVIRAKKTDSYDEMLELCEALLDLARETGVHVQALGHCKKVLQEDPFDNFMGSAEVRNATDTNVIIFDRMGKRLLQSETRMGVPWEATELHAEVVSVGEAPDQSMMVKRFYLTDTLEKTEKERKAAEERLAKESNHSRLVRYLRERGGQAKYVEYLNDVSGRTETKHQTVAELVQAKIVRVSGVPRSPIHPQMIHLLEPVFAPPAETKPTEGAPPILLCADSDCTNAVEVKGAYCYRHKIAAESVRVTNA